MKSRFIAVLAAGLVSASPAFATNITIDFEGPTSFASIDQYYNGGTDQGGLLSGPNLGVSFGLDALELKNDQLGPYFSNAPSSLGVMTPVGPAAVMNVLAGSGFNGEVSFYYSSSYSSPNAPSVSVFSGLDGTGSLLGSFSLANNAQSNGCSDSPYCNWQFASIVLGPTDVARSIAFGDAANAAGFDNVTVNVVPEPGSLALLTFGLAGMGVSTRSGRLARRKQASL